MIVVLDARWARECGLVVVGAQSIIVSLSTMRFFKSVQYNADHWQSDGVENLLETFEQSRGRTRRHFLMKYHRLWLPPLPDVEPAARVPVQPEFSPRRVYIRHADLEKWG